MEISAAEQFVEKHYRHNFLFNMLDGAMFWIGYSFIAPGLILPLYASHFTDNNLLLGIIPSMSAVGYMLPQLFTANWAQRLPLKKVLPVNLGFFTERLPIFLLAPAAYFLAGSSPLAALAALYLFFGWHSLGAGLVAVGWQDMIAKVIPIDRRGRFMGITSFLGNGTGALGAAGAAWLLANYEFPGGYVLAFAVAALFIFLSWAFLAQTREPPVVTHTETHSQLEYFRQLPAVVRADPNFRNFLIAQAVLNLAGMANGFLMIYAARTWGLPDSYAGTFTSVMMLFQAAANLGFGLLADRRGYKLLVELSCVLGMLAIGLAVAVPAPWIFFVVFALRGAATAAGFISSIAITMEFTTAELRPTYIGLSNTISGLAGFAAPLLGGWLANSLGFSAMFVICIGIGLAGLAGMFWLVKDPRKSSG